MSPGHDREGYSERIRSVLAIAHPTADLNSVRFLAAGEYTYNFRLRLGDDEAVLRVITGSQMGLAVGAQALYEAHALDILAATGRVPPLMHVETEPGPVGYPYLLLGFLPGRPLVYHSDLIVAAQCVAALHQCPPPPGHRLQVHADPVLSILHEANVLIATLDGADWAAVRALKERVAATPAQAFAAIGFDQAIINTDLNSHNFIVRDSVAWLLDWEKARLGPTLMDIAHFLLPTTTLWRDATATRLTRDQRETFIDAYVQARGDLDSDAYREALQPALQLAALRAIAWCAWALAASERGERPIENEETLARSKLFTSAPFLDALADELWT